MTSPTPRLKSPNTTPESAPAAQQASHHSSSGTKGDGRQAVISALSAAQQPTSPPTGDGRYPVAWLHVRAPRGASPAATSVCACGRDRYATGQRKVLALIEDHAAHRTVCPLRSPERRNAA
ncbi:hypothetical protein ACIGW3_08665 [Streptomyces sp. NPDC053499]|uniref:hypothetical protein n=1 Tax=Streptomyces sp. NPDC053499 TaxID=3365707 RepID=UPI0037D5BEFD